MSMIRGLLSGAAAAVLVALSGGVVAAGAGQIQHLSGTLSVQRADGSVRILSQKSEVNPGEVLTTQRDSYAQINFSDGSSMTMRPNTQMKLESYQFIQDKPQEDSAFFRLIKGGLRTVTGLVGKRGNRTRIASAPPPRRSVSAGLRARPSIARKVATASCRVATRRKKRCITTR